MKCKIKKNKLLKTQINNNCECNNEINELKLQMHKQNEEKKALELGIENINNSYEKELNELKSMVVELSMHTTPTNEISHEESHSAQSKIIHLEFQSIVHEKLSSKAQQINSKLKREFIKEKEEYDMAINNLNCEIKQLMC